MHIDWICIIKVLLQINCAGMESYPKGAGAKSMRRDDYCFISRREVYK